MGKQLVLRLPKRETLQDLEAFEEEIPVPQPHEVLVKIRSVSLNFRDFAVATGKYPFPVKDHVVPGSDMAGEVADVGSRVDGGFQKGDVVISSFDLKTMYGAMQQWTTSLGGMYDGVMRQYICLPESALIKIPNEAKLSFPQLASLVCTGVTAWNALYGNVALKPGQTVLCLGTGGVSVTALILAKAAGAKTIVTSSSDAKLAYVQKTYGVDAAINYNKHPVWSDEVQRITNGRGADHILENGGAGTIAESIKSACYGGIISVIGFLASCSQDRMPDVAALALSRGVCVRGIMVGSKQQLEDVTRFVVEKGLPVPVEKEFGFSRDEVVEALEYMTSGQHVGKVCLNVA